MAAAAAALQTVGVMLLVPADVLRPRRPDDHFAGEAAAASQAGAAVALVDHDALTEPGGAGRGVSRVPADGGEAVYRGWMLRSEQYAAFTGALAGRGVTLRTSAAAYQRAHELPGWYSALASVTPESVWTQGDAQQDFSAACSRLGSGPAVLRDYVKSMKHYWDEAAFIPDVADQAAAWTVARRFRVLRDEEFTGGFVLRRFEDLGRAEVRTWWVDGTCRLVTAHPDTSGVAAPSSLDLTWLAPLAGSLGLPFVTIDLALRADGVWRVVELGDGQVSDRPSSTDPATFVAAVLPRVQPA
jgi:hypothetical protein